MPPGAFFSLSSVVPMNNLTWLGRKKLRTSSSSTDDCVTAVMSRSCAQCSGAFVAPNLHRSFVQQFNSTLSRLCPRISASSPVRQKSRGLRMAVPPPPEDGDEPRNEQNPFIDMDVLRRRMSDLDDRSKAGHSPSDRVSPELVSVEEHEIGDSDLKRFVHNFEHLTSVWVIAFTSAVDGTEGIYSLSVSDENIVLAFEDKEEAQRYALCLEAQKFPAPQISELETTELCDFCNESGFRLGFVPKGSLVTPPEESAIEDLDKWRGKPPRSKGQTGMSDEEIDIMKKRLDSLFGL